MDTPTLQQQSSYYGSPVAEHTHTHTHYCMIIIILVVILQTTIGVFILLASSILATLARVVSTTLRRSISQSLYPYELVSYRYARMHNIMHNMHTTLVVVRALSTTYSPQYSSQQYAYSTYVCTRVQLQASTWCMHTTAVHHSIGGGGYVCTVQYYRTLFCI